MVASIPLTERVVGMKVDASHLSCSSKKEVADCFAAMDDGDMSAALVCENINGGP